MLSNSCDEAIERMFALDYANLIRRFRKKGSLTS
jgi:hypothetical protein